MIYVNIHIDTSQALSPKQFKQILKLLAGKRLGTRWAKYPFSQCRIFDRTATEPNRLIPEPADNQSRQHMFLL